MPRVREQGAESAPSEGSADAGSDPAQPDGAGTKPRARLTSRRALLAAALSTAGVGLLGCQFGRRWTGDVAIHPPARSAERSGAVEPASAAGEPGVDDLS